jgi:uncharacterized protein YkwD
MFCKAYNLCGKRLYKTYELDRSFTGCCSITGSVERLEAGFCGYLDRPGRLAWKFYTGLSSLHGSVGTAGAYFPQAGSLAIAARIFADAVFFPAFTGVAGHAYQKSIVSVVARVSRKSFFGFGARGYQRMDLYISRLAGPLAMQSEWANKKLAPVFDEAVRQTMNSLTVEPASNEFVSLRFTYTGARPRPSLEEAMLKMVNKERVERGLKPLAADPELTTVARAHSQDMFIRGYFAHRNPDNKGPFDRMKAAGVRFSAAGENLALAQTLEIAHQNLMNSPGHRANILSPDFGRLGIGVMDGGFYGLMISQEFRN